VPYDERWEPRTSRVTRLQSDKSRSGGPRRCPSRVMADLTAWKAAPQKLELAVVVRFVLGDMKPLGMVVPVPLVVDDSKPLVVALAELAESFLARLV
jgi:hypothetical protein